MFHQLLSVRYSCMRVDTLIWLKDAFDNRSWMYVSRSIGLGNSNDGQDESQKLLESSKTSTYERCRKNANVNEEENVGRRRESSTDTIFFSKAPISRMGMALCSFTSNQHIFYIFLWHKTSSHDCRNLESYPRGRTLPSSSFPSFCAWKAAPRASHNSP